MYELTQFETKNIFNIPIHQCLELMYMGKIPGEIQVLVYRTFLYQERDSPLNDLISHHNGINALKKRQGCL